MTTEWQPDTCSCVMTYDEIRGESGVPIWLSFKSCGIHTNATAAYYSNINKNIDLVKMAKALDMEIQELAGKAVFKMENDGKLSWDFPGFTEEQKVRARDSIRG